MKVWVTKMPDPAKHGCGEGCTEGCKRRDLLDTSEAYCWDTVSDVRDSLRNPRVAWIVRWDELYALGFRRVLLEIEEVQVEPDPGPYVPPPPRPGEVSIGGSSTSCLDSDVAIGIGAGGEA